MRPSQGCPYNWNKVTVTDVNKVKTFGITQFIPSSACGHHQDFKRLLSGTKKYRQGCVLGVFLTDIIELSEPRSDSERGQAYIENGTNGLWKRGCCEEVSPTDFGADANTLE